MSALAKVLEYGGSPGGKELLKKLGWLGAGVVAGGTGKELVGLARDELSGENSLKRAVLTEVDAMAKDPDKLLNRVNQASSIYANLKRGFGGGQQG